MHQDDRKFPLARSEVLLSEERYHSMNPLLLLQLIGVKSGMVIADLGCGNGFFSIPAAGLVAPDGKVYALDSSEEMLRRLRERELPPNLEARLSQENRFPLPDHSVDFALAVRLFHELDDRTAFLLEIRRVLRQSGGLWIMDWLPKEEDEGPPIHLRIPPDELRAAVAGAGFSVAWLRMWGRSHYHLLARKGKSA